MGRLPAKDIIRQYRPVVRWRYEELTKQITSTELGVQRALVVALGGKEPSDIPSYDEMTKRNDRKDRLPAWQRQFEKVNPGAIQTG